MSAIAGAIGSHAAIFEYGSGASEKIKQLLGGLSSPAVYVAMDISRDYLINSAQTIAQRYPSMEVSAVCADFVDTIRLPDDFHADVDHWTGYFPGSTLGNFSPEAAAAFLRRAAQTLGERRKEPAAFLLGVDLVKDAAILNRAYDDRDGVTAAFNLNLLSRMRRELDAEVDLDAFAHRAFFNEAQSRIEMHLRAERETRIVIDDHVFPFAPGETLFTECSYKYTRTSLEALLADTPWRLQDCWTDPEEWFAVCLLRNG